MKRSGVGRFKPNVKSQAGRNTPAGLARRRQMEAARAEQLRQAWAQQAELDRQEAARRKLKEAEEQDDLLYESGNEGPIEDDQKEE